MGSVRALREDRSNGWPFGGKWEARESMSLGQGQEEDILVYGAIILMVQVQE